MENEPEVTEQQEAEQGGDTSHAYDMVSVFKTLGENAEEAIAVHRMLIAAGLDAVLAGSSPLPTLTNSIEVPMNQREDALRLIEEARAAGPAAADEAELAGESPSPETSTEA